MERDAGDIIEARRPGTCTERYTDTQTRSKSPEVFCSLLRHQMAEWFNDVKLSKKAYVPDPEPLHATRATL